MAGPSYLSGWWPPHFCTWGAGSLWGRGCRPCAPGRSSGSLGERRGRLGGSLKTSGQSQSFMWSLWKWPVKKRAYTPNSHFNIILGEMGDHFLHLHILFSAWTKSRSLFSNTHMLHSILPVRSTIQVQKLPESRKMKFNISSSPWPRTDGFSMFTSEQGRAGAWRWCFTEQNGTTYPLDREGSEIGKHRWSLTHDGSICGFFNFTCESNMHSVKTIL